MSGSTKVKKIEKNYQGKLYKDTGLCIRDSKWVADEYMRGVALLAQAIDKVSRARDALELARDTTEDNGDPAFTVQEALVKLGEAMAYAFNYHAEYMAEINMIDGPENGEVDPTCTGSPI